MSSLIYKSGQGYWTRVISAAGAALLILYCGLWLYSDQLQHLDNIYLKFGIAFGVVAACAVISFIIFNKPKIVDFFIATDSEMKKVNWPTKREVRGSTVVVILGTFLLAAILFVIDLAFTFLFIKIGVLEG